MFAWQIIRWCIFAAFVAAIGTGAATQTVDYLTGEVHSKIFSGLTIVFGLSCGWFWFIENKWVTLATDNAGMRNDAADRLLRESIKRKKGTRRRLVACIVVAAILRVTAAFCEGEKVDTGLNLSFAAIAVGWSLVAIAICLIATALHEHFITQDLKISLEVYRSKQDRRAKELERLRN